MKMVIEYVIAISFIVFICVYLVCIHQVVLDIRTAVVRLDERSIHLRSDVNKLEQQMKYLYQLHITENLTDSSKIFDHGHDEP